MVDCSDLNGKSKFVDIVGFGSSKTVVFFVDDKFRQFGSALQKKKYIENLLKSNTFLCGHSSVTPTKLLKNCQDENVIFSIGNQFKFQKVRIIPGQCNISR